MPFDQTTPSGERPGPCKDVGSPVQKCPLINKITKVEILHGDNDVEAPDGALQFVNVEWEKQKFTKGPHKITDSERRLGRYLRVRVTFEKQIPASFTLTMERTSDLDRDYTAVEKRGYEPFTYTSKPVSQSVGSNGKVILDGFFKTDRKGGCTYRFTGRDEYGNVAHSKSVKTKRVIYYQEFVMAGVSYPAKPSKLTQEYDKRSITFITLPQQRIRSIPNVNPFDQAQFDGLKAALQAAYDGSDAKKFTPYSIVNCVTQHLLKPGNIDVVVANVTVGPRQAKKTISVSADGSKLLWRNVVPGEDWFISGEFQPDAAPRAAPPAPMTIGRAAVSDVSNPDYPEAAGSVSIDCGSIGTTVLTGTVKLKVKIIDFSAAGVSFGPNNVICIAGRTWWRPVAVADIPKTEIHEIGHKIGLCPTGGTLDAGPNLYTGRDHVGPHCAKGVTIIDHMSSYASDKPQCAMFGRISDVVDLCDDCGAAATKTDLAAGWNSV